MLPMTTYTQDGAHGAMAMATAMVSAMAMAMGPGPGPFLIDRQTSKKQVPEKCAFL